MQMFKSDKSTKTNSNSIILGEKYRISVIFGNLIRFEYQEDGAFEDRATQFAFNRFFDKPYFNVKDNNNEIIITTNDWVITYNKNLPFSDETLKFKSLINNEIYVLSDEDGNYGGTARTLDGINGPIPLEKGLFSEKGFVVLDDSNSLIFENDWFENREKDTQDIYFLGYHNDFQLGLKEYYKLTGNTPLVPRYALGNWWSKFWDLNDDEMKYIVNRYKKEQIPLSVFVIDMDWHLVHIPPKYGGGWTGYTWNKDFFPNPTESLKWLHDNNLATSINLHPADGIRGHEDAYKDLAIHMGIDPETEEPIPFDATDRKFMDGYFKHVLHPMEKDGVDFWWIDWQQGTKTKLKHLDPLWVLNHFHYHDLTRDGKRGMTFSRYTNLGGHRYPIGFSGDTIISWESLAFQPYFTSTASNIGFGWWSHDIGGHDFGSENKELYTRWIQYGVFAPIFRTHSTKCLYHKRVPWRWDEQVLGISRRFMQLRHALIPYIYSMAKINADGGFPLIRPLYYHHNKIKAAYNKPNQYYFGSELMVSPYVTPLDKDINHSIQKVYLPKGDWYNFNDGSYFKGSKTYTLYGTLEEMPIFAKAGAIIPLNQDFTELGVNNPKNLEVQIFPGKSNKFVLFEDDGISLPTENNFVETIFDYKYTNKKVTLKVNLNGDKSFIPENRNYIIKFRSVNKDIEVNTKVEYEKSYDYETNTLILKLVDVRNKDFKIELTSANIIVNNFNDVEQRLTDVILNTSFLKTDKIQVGYVYREFATHKFGVLGTDLSIENKIKEIKKLVIPRKLKQLSINILSYIK